MTRPTTLRSLLLASAALFAAGPAFSQDAARGFGPNPDLPKPQTSHEAKNYSKVVGWKQGQTPVAGQGLKVQRFAGELQSPRWLLALPNGDVLVAEATTIIKPEQKDDPKVKGQQQSGSAAPESANRITLLRDRDRDGVAEERHVLLSGLSQPFGLAFIGKTLFVANTDGVMRYDYELGQTRVEGKGARILELPAGGYNNHWTRNLLPSLDGKKLYVSVGSASNVGEYGLDTEKGRAAIHEVAIDGSGHRLLATGLRNPVGMSIEPVSGRLWTVVNERDMLGDDLVPDYLTSVQDGGFYGWPYSYWGRNPDPRLKGQGAEQVAKALTPDYALGPHTASLGLHFYTGAMLPERYKGGAFIAQRGSWNREPFSGYRVLMVPFEDGKPSGAPVDVLTGFMPRPETGEVHGRPVGVFQDATGALLVTDDAGNSIWRVSAADPS